MAERMERFNVSLAPFNEALEHVRSILLYLSRCL